MEMMQISVRVSLLGLRPSSRDFLPWHLVQRPLEKREIARAKSWTELLSRRDE